MKIQRIDDAGDFLDRTLTLRANLPFETNLLGSVASSIAFTGKKYDETFWWIIQSAESEVVGAMMRTAPYNLVLSPMPTTAIPSTLSPTTLDRINNQVIDRATSLRTCRIEAPETNWKSQIGHDQRL